MSSCVGSIVAYSLSLARAEELDDTVVLPGWFGVDLGLYAKINETWKAQFNIENLFDQGYWACADGNNNITPGLPAHVPGQAGRQFLTAWRS